MPGGHIGHGYGATEALDAFGATLEEAYMMGRGANGR